MKIKRNNNEVITIKMLPDFDEKGIMLVGGYMSYGLNFIAEGVLKIYKQGELNGRAYCFAGGLMVLLMWLPIIVWNEKRKIDKRAIIFIWSLNCFSVTMLLLIYFSWILIGIFFTEICICFVGSYVCSRKKCDNSDGRR